jgi:hypothetical protein
LTAFDETVKISTTVDERSSRWNLRTAVSPSALPIAAQTAVVDIEAPAEREVIDHLPALVERFTKERLRAWHTSKGDS